MKDYRGILIMSDLDGTFMGAGGKLVSRNLEALARFRAGGGLFSFATGRVHTTIEQVLLPGWKQLINAPAIMCNGACVYDPQAGKVLHEVTVDGRILRPLLSPLLESGKYDPVIYAGGAYECYSRVSLADIPSNLWHKAVLNGTRQDILAAKEAISSRCDGSFRCFRTGWRIFELLPPNGGKGAMLSFLKDYYKQQGRDLVTIGVGDFENDIDLLEGADIAIAPENALDDVKAKAHRVLCANTQGVIADIIEAIDRGELV